MLLLCQNNEELIRRNENMEKKKILSILFAVLLYGALWGIFEATLGTVLHLPFFEAGKLFTKSSIIMVPIAFFFMTLCYKKTGSLLSVLFVGLVSATIKLSTAFVMGMTIYVYFPAIYIVAESLAMMGALAIFRPTKVLSLQSFASFVAANTTYQFTYICIGSITAVANPSLTKNINAFANMQNWQKVGEKYLFTYNGVAIVYALVLGGALYGLYRLALKFDLNTKLNLKKIIYSPITASVALVAAFALTISLATIK